MPCDVVQRGVCLTPRSRLDGIARSWWNRRDFSLVLMTRGGPCHRPDPGRSVPGPVSVEKPERPGSVPWFVRFVHLRVLLSLIQKKYLYLYKGATSS